MSNVDMITKLEQFTHSGSKSYGEAHHVLLSQIDWAFFFAEQHLSGQMHHHFPATWIRDRLSVGQSSYIRSFLHLVFPETDPFHRRNQDLFDNGDSSENLVEFARFDCVRLDLSITNVGNPGSTLVYFDLAWIGDQLYPLLTIQRHDATHQSYAPSPNVPQCCTKFFAAISILNPEAYDEMKKLMLLDDQNGVIWSDSLVLPHTLDKFEEICVASNEHSFTSIFHGAPKPHHLYTPAQSSVKIIYHPLLSKDYFEAHYFKDTQKKIYFEKYFVQKHLGKIQVKFILNFPLCHKNFFKRNIPNNI